MRPTTDPELLRTLGARLRRLRAQARWSQEKLAEAVGIASNNISNAENGKRGLAFGTLVAVARALGVRLAELVDVDAPLPAVREPPEEADEMMTLFSGFDREDRDLVLALARQIARQRAGRR